MKSFSKTIKALAALTVLAASTLAQAQDWPNKPVKFIVPAPAGSGPDIVARIVADKLSGMWGQSVVVENRVGAGGIPAMVALKQAPADGYTYGVVQTAVIALTPHLFKDPQFNFDNDFMTISSMVTSPLIIAATPNLGVSTLPQLVALAKSKPGQVKFALPGLNSVPHLAGEQISALTGMKFLNVPFNGTGPAIVATISGDAGEITIDAPAALMPNVKAGKLKALAITTPRRVAGMDDIPTVAETIPNYQASGWFSLFAAQRTPDAVVTRVNRDVNTVMQMPDIVARLVPMALYPAPGTPAAAASFVKAERDRWTSVVRDLGIKPE
ncbi:MAG: tripartite tricarboxylate transporter substrate binding protein [Pseudomonadota bacterium]